MVSIRNLIDSDEKVLWERTIGKDTKRETKYIITNKRAYKKNYKIPSIDYSNAPKEFLSVKDDILIIARPGIKKIKKKTPRSVVEKIIRIAEKTKLALETAKKVKDKKDEIQQNIQNAQQNVQNGNYSEAISEVASSVSSNSSSPPNPQKIAKQLGKKLRKKYLKKRNVEVYLKFALEDKPFMVFEKFLTKEAKEITKYLKDKVNIPYEYRISFEQHHITQEEPVYQEQLQNSYSGPSSYIQHSNQSPSQQSQQIPTTQQSPPPLFQPSYQQTQSPHQGHEYITPFSYPENVPSQIPEAQPIFETPLNPYLTPNLGGGVIKTSQIIEIFDKNSCAGNCCCNCGNDLTTYQERIFSCQECGELYHESCIETLVREGTCSNCNRILLW